MNYDVVIIGGKLLNKVFAYRNLGGGRIMTIDIREHLKLINFKIMIF